MGQSLHKIVPAGNQHKETEKEEIERAIGDCYDKYFTKGSPPKNYSEFYYAVCKTLEEINKSVGNTQISFPDMEILREAYNKHVPEGMKTTPTREKFQEILKEVLPHVVITGIGVKDTLLYLFGVPATALLFKTRLMPLPLPNEIFIPAVTSITVLALAKFNKI